MAPDGKMYMAETSQSFISVINNPDLIGTACQFVHGQISLPSNATLSTRSTYGLPTFIQSYWKPGFTFRGACTGNTINFDYERSSDEIFVKWDFGDPASGVNNTSTLDSTQHLYNNDGLYDVKLIRFLFCGNDTVTKQVRAGKLQVKLGSDTILCGANQHALRPQVSSWANTYLWQDGSSGPGFIASQDG